MVCKSSEPKKGTECRLETSHESEYHLNYFGYQISQICDPSLFKYQLVNRFKNVIEKGGKKTKNHKTNLNDEEGIYYCPAKCSYSWKSTLAHSGIHIFTNLFAALAAYTYSI